MSLESSYTAVPGAEGSVMLESTPIPTKTHMEEEEDDDPIPSQVLSGSAVAKDESRTRKVLVRVLSGALMVSRAVNVMHFLQRMLTLFTDWNLFNMSVHGTCVYMCSGGLCGATFGKTSLDLVRDDDSVTHCTPAVHSLLC